MCRVIGNVYTVASVYWYVVSGEYEVSVYADGGSYSCVCWELASSPGRQLKFGKKDGLVSIATPLVRMRWPLPEKVVIVYFACKPFRKLTCYWSASF